MNGGTALTLDLRATCRGGTMCVSIPDGPSYEVNTSLPAFPLQGGSRGARSRKGGSLVRSLLQNSVIFFLPGKFEFLDETFEFVFGIEFNPGQTGEVGGEV